MFLSLLMLTISPSLPLATPSRRPEQKASCPETKMAVFVVHNKLKEKRGKIPEGVAYFPGANIADRWVDVSAIDPARRPPHPSC